MKQFFAFLDAKKLKQLSEDKMDVIYGCQSAKILDQIGGLWIVMP